MLRKGVPAKVSKKSWFYRLTKNERRELYYHYSWVIGHDLVSVHNKLHRIHSTITKKIEGMFHKRLYEELESEGLLSYPTADRFFHPYRVEERIE